MGFWCEYPPWYKRISVISVKTMEVLFSIVCVSSNTPPCFSLHAFCETFAKLEWRSEKLPTKNSRRWQRLYRSHCHWRHKGCARPLINLMALWSNHLTRCTTLINLTFSGWNLMNLTRIDDHLVAVGTGGTPFPLSYWTSPLAVIIAIAHA